MVKPRSAPTITFETVTPSISATEIAAITREAEFGDVTTPHMISMAWSVSDGWHEPRLRPYGNLAIDPTAMVLHYGQAIFEGLKAYRQADGRIAVFRPTAVARRMRASAHRVAMPELPEELFVAAVDTLVRQDSDWVPHEPGRALYLRPVLFADEPALALRPARHHQFVLVASPTAPLRTMDGHSARVWLSTIFSRAAPGGTGTAKFGGNYAGSFLAQQRAADEGCDQVVWLDAGSHRWIEELGGMNLFLVRQRAGLTTLITPALTDTILAGVTRDSVLTLARDLGFGIEERAVSVSEWHAGCLDGTITETFATGTAATVMAVGTVRGEGTAWSIGDGWPGPVTSHLGQSLTDIQQGRSPDVHGWMHYPSL